MDFINVWSVTRAFKFLGLALFFLGLAGAVVPNARRVRLSATYRLVVPGLVVAYGAGWLLMKLSGRSLTTPWLALGAVTGAMAAHMAFLMSHLPRPRPATIMLTWGCATAAMAVMSLRIDGAGLVVVAIAGLIFGAAAAWPFSRGEVALSADDPAATWRGFCWVMRFEAISLLTLVGAMLLRRAYGINIDSGTGVLAWTHGILFLVFVQSLASAGRILKWTWADFALGVGTAFVPGASFWFEWHLRNRTAVACRPESAACRNPSIAR